MSAVLVTVPLSAVGVLLPAAAPPALAVPRATAPAVPAATGAVEEWTPATDTPSGVSAELPGEAEEKKTSVPVGGEPVSGRVYGVETGEAFVGFAVFDTPGAARDLRAGLKGFLDAYERESGETLRTTDVRATTVDGRPALDARLSSSDDMAGATRFIGAGGHVVQAVTFGPEDNRKDLDGLHRRLLAGLRLP
ncbi:hypothetical protein [Streptomyces sp. NPDC007883]|uniref:hypothetical protein n=1 Tax=Streptomyces sp. NPDC007883 TaxID=3155116 RepID=UPI0033CBAFC6